MPRRRFFKLAEAMAMILEDDDVADGDVVVLPPSKVDEHSDCEYFDDNEMLTTDSLPGDVAGSVEVHYSTRNRHRQQPHLLNVDVVQERRNQLLLSWSHQENLPVFQSQTKAFRT